MPQPVSVTRMDTAVAPLSHSTVTFAAGLGELRRVRQEIHDDLLQLGRIGAHHEALSAGVATEVQVLRFHHRPL